MAKRQSFADKALKKKQVVNCRVCKSPMVATKVIFPQKSANGSVKYKTDIVNVCKCNHKEIYG
jgi:hypothetical protein